MQHELTDRRVRLLARLGPDTLDLSDPGARALVVAAGRPGGRVGRTYRAVLSVGELVRFPDLLLALRGVERLLADDGDAWLVEPVQHTGFGSLLAGTAWSVHPAVAGVHVERDVARVARTAGLTIVDLERFSPPTAVYPLRLFIQARARPSRRARA